MYNYLTQSIHKQFRYRDLLHQNHTYVFAVHTIIYHSFLTSSCYTTGTGNDSWGNNYHLTIIILHKVAYQAAF